MPCEAELGLLLHHVWNNLHSRNAQAHSHKCGGVHQNPQLESARRIFHRYHILVSESRKYSVPSAQEAEVSQLLLPYDRMDIDVALEALV